MVNKKLWSFKKSSRMLVQKLIKKIQALFFVPTVTLLKNIDYRNLPSPVAWEKIAGDRDVFVEIGSGHGEVLLANNKNKSISIGYEIKSRFFRLTQRKTRKRDDVFIYKGSGYESLFLHFKDQSVAKLFILFPDPWHKKRHAKRRPLTADLFARVAQRMKNGGMIIIATDWSDYADFIKEESKKVEHIYQVEVKAYQPADLSLPVTHFHQKWVRKGRTFTAIVLKKLD